MGVTYISTIEDISPKIKTLRRKVEKDLFLAKVTLTFGKVNFDLIKVKRSIRGTYIPNIEDLRKEIRVL